MFSATERSGSRLNSWKTVEMPACCACSGWLNVTCSPATSMVPASGWWTPASSFISVDLPAPFSPTRPSTWPARSSRSASASTVWPAKLLVSPRARSTTVALVGVGGRQRVGVDVRGRAHLATVARVTDFCRESGRSCLLDVTKSRCLTVRVRTSDVFDLLRDGQPRTRAQLAETSGLARSTITSRIDTLIRLGLVVPIGDAASTGGRPPSLLAFNPAARVVAGIDLGASHATAALADLSGTVLAERRTDLDIARGTRARARLGRPT